MQEVVLSEEEKNELRKVQIEMLDVMVELCNKHNLKYYLLGGTCLGAVRHKGFIPWDDDIDVALPREDYDKFAEICKTELDGKYFYQNVQSEKKHPQLFSRLRKNNTLFVEDRYRDFKINHGIYIDIFPLDGMSNDVAMAQKHFDSFEFYKKMVRLGNTFRKAFFKDLAVFFIKIFVGIIGRENLLKKVPKLENKYSLSDSSLIGNLYGRWGIKEVMDKNIMIDPDGRESFLSFEGKLYRVPYNYDAYLTHLYGDYMTPPPIEKRASHHGIIKLCFDCDAKNEESVGEVDAK